MDTLDANRTVARRVFTEFFAAHDLALADELIGDEFVDRSPVPGQPPGRAGVRWLNDVLHAAHSDATFTVDDTIAEGDRVVVRWTLRGVRTTAPFPGPPAGEAVEQTVIAIFRLADGRIVERWAAFAH